MIVPILLIINLYRYFNYTEGYEFRGFHYLYTYISTFNGLDSTMLMLEYFKSCIYWYQSTDISTFADVLSALGNFFKAVFFAFAMPVALVWDILQDVFWVLRMFMSV